jgi:hypothetical protein
LSRNSLESFKLKALNEFDINFPENNLFSVDLILETPELKVDILVGNPPWANFTDLPHHYKEILKSFFVKYGLVPNKKDVLLGSSRTDIAALVIKVALGHLLNKSGSAYFYVPTSLFSGDRAHAGFRDYLACDRPFSIESVYEFTNTKIFTEISTSYACAEFQIDRKQYFPASYHIESYQLWTEFHAKPLHSENDPWQLFPINTSHIEQHIPKITVAKHQQPRQGVNTCGANDLFIFTEKPSFIPTDFLFPMAGKELWKNPDSKPNRWIFLPYNSHTARPISLDEIKAHKDLFLYLGQAEDKLKLRKGTLIQSQISKGCWWCLLGVGPYSFSPYKILWEAYGKKEFRPILLTQFEGKPWQGNQAMHAFIPSWDLKDACRILEEFSSPMIGKILAQLNGSGKCNWAQPGKIKSLLLSSQKQHESTQRLF